MNCKNPNINNPKSEIRNPKLIGLLQEALGLHQDENLTEAACLYHKILETDPENVDAIFLLGTLNLQQRNLDLATTFLKRAIKLKPDHVRAYNNLGTALQAQGKLAEAVAGFNKVIELQPDYAEAHYNLGNALRKDRKLDEAIRSYRQSITFNPNDPEAYYNLGNVLKEQGKLDEAAENYRQAIKLKPDYAMTYCNLGTLLQEQGKLDEALESYRQAIKLKPDYAMAHCNLGTLFKEQGKPDEALESYRQAIKLKPDEAMTYCNLGALLQEQGKLDEATANYNRAIEVIPNYAEAHYNLGTALQEQNKLDEAVTSYNRAIEDKPDYAEAYYNLGTALQEQDKLDEAVSSYNKAIALKPDYANAYNNLSTVLQEQGKLDEATANYNRAIGIDQNYTEAYYNLGTVLHKQRKPNEAIKNYNRSISLKPDYAEAHFNKSLALLLTGNFKEGWPEYEWRLRKKDCTSHTFQQPQWNGTLLDGKSILVHAEQGFGDNIQFVRYLPMVKAKGGHVIFECQKNLFRLLKSCAGIDEIIEQQPTRTPVVQFDIHVPLLSLPGIFGTSLNTIPSDIPYITVNSTLRAQWKRQLGHDNDFKIGIVWAGRPTHTCNDSRSCSLSDFAPLADIPDLIFYSLQKGQASAEVNDPPKEMKIINLEDSLIDFADTAAVIANLDLVISVDTAVVHLAGALDKPVWTLLSFIPDWRWFLDRDDSPWYPGMRLFRQSQPNDWTGVFEQVKKALIQEIVDFRLRIAE